PPRLHGAQPELIAARKVQTENGPMVSEIFAVRYVTAVSWTVTHHGISSTNSAGADDARMDPTCPLAIIDTTGVDGRLTDPLSDTSPTSMPVTGPTSTWPVTLAAIAALLLGAGFMILARRPSSGDHEKTITGHKPGSN
ncbi:MAG: LPXTG cell wall anchor domain-containing protein, partial [Ilumatobacter sp.]|nr:LPXTG cell wall anchor domain-containing protein [Ilumatobacter sp.]